MTYYKHTFEVLTRAMAGLHNTFREIVIYGNDFSKAKKRAENIIIKAGHATQADFDARYIAICIIKVEEVIQLKKGKK